MADKQMEYAKINQRNREHYDQIRLVINKKGVAPKNRMNGIHFEGGKEAIKAHAQDNGESMNQFIIRAIKETMERDIENK